MHRFWFGFYKLPITPRLLQAIGEIPLLRSLSLEEMRSFHLNGPLIAPALANAHQLERLVFEVRHLKMQEDVDTAHNQARALVIACPNLESLELGRQCAQCLGGCKQCKLELNFSYILQDPDIGGSPPPPAPLRTLTVRRGVIISPSSPQTMGCLSNLTSLFLSNSDKQHQPMWSILRGLGVKLLSLTVEACSDPLVQYLSSYEGLMEFNVGEGKASPELGQGALERSILFESLPHHRGTLQQICLLPSRLCQGNPPFERIYAWAVDHDTIPGWLEQFAHLKTLGLVVYAENERLLNCMVGYANTTNYADTHMSPQNLFYPGTNHSCFNIVSPKFPH